MCDLCAFKQTNVSNVHSFIDGRFSPDFNTRLVLCAYADDTIVVVKNKEDVKRLGNIVETSSIQATVHPAVTQNATSMILRRVPGLVRCDNEAVTCSG